MAMDQWLAKIYGTDGAADDLEKTAQSHLLQKLAEEQGIDLSGLSEDQIQELATETFGTESIAEDTDMVDQAAVEQQMAKEAQAKFEEADFLGRVMAHSYTQELEKIAGARELAGRAAGAIERGGRSVSDRLGRAGAAAGKKIGEGAKSLAGSRVGKAVGHGVSSAHKALGRGASAAGGHLSKHRGKYTAGAGAAAAGYGAHKAMHKEASAFEKLAMEHAQALLGNAEQVAQQNPALHQAIQAQMQGQQVQPQQVEQGQQFRQALDERALEILAENGYDTDEVVGLLNGGADAGQVDGGQMHDPAQLQ